MKKGSKKALRPPQRQKKQPGVESKMTPKPRAERSTYVGSGKLKDKVIVITGGDSGIGRAAAIACAKESADLVIVYLNEHADAKETKRQVEEEARACLLIAGDIGNERFCANVIKRTINEFKKIDVLINNAAVQFPQKDIENITSRQLEKTFRTNIFSFFYMTKAAMPHLKKGIDHQHYLSDRISWQPKAFGLFSYQRCNCHIYAFTCIKPGIQKNQGKCGSSRTDLDSADPGHIRCEKCLHIWQ